MSEPFDLDALRTDYADTVACLKNERLRAGELLRERDAEIARLREVFDRTCKQHSEAMCRTCNAHEAEIASLKMMIMKEEEMVGLLDEIARLRTPPGADVLVEEGRRFDNSLETQLARFEDAVNYYEPSATPGADAKARALDIFQGEITGWIDRAERALQQYGDERAREAADQANRVYELHNRLVGHVEMDSESRAVWVVKQYLDGLHIGENNRESIKDYLAGHFQQAMVDAAAAAREAAIEECAQVTAGPWPATRLYQDDTRFLQTKAVAAIRALSANPGSET